MVTHTFTVRQCAENRKKNQKKKRFFLSFLCASREYSEGQKGDPTIQPRDRVRVDTGRGDRTRSLRSATQTTDSARQEVIGESRNFFCFCLPSCA